MSGSIRGQVVAFLLCFIVFLLILIIVIIFRSPNSALWHHGYLFSLFLGIFLIEVLSDEEPVLLLRGSHWLS
jgi:hypothetical protein